MGRRCSHYRCCTGPLLPSCVSLRRSTNRMFALCLTGSLVVSALVVVARLAASRSTAQDGLAQSPGVVRRNITLATTHNNLSTATTRATIRIRPHRPTITSQPADTMVNSRAERLRAISAVPVAMIPRCSLVATRRLLVHPRVKSFAKGMRQSMSERARRHPSC
jgi:hypothetical protein